MNINLHIDRLILDGLDLAHDQRPLLQAAVQTELGRLLTAGGLSNEIAGAGALPRVAGDAIQVQQQSGPQDTGHRIAASVYGAIGAPKT
ncbi:MAG TPA: hypothetical protein VL907_11285 [Pyrinomonadaceae bacterium]|jgi:hypothetical protein|nr:hypothetical protein [Pyrinomonadaceae bacterium]